MFWCKATTFAPAGQALSKSVRVQPPKT
jgi:hypothetical protein